MFEQTQNEPETKSFYNLFSISSHPETKFNKNDFAASKIVASRTITIRDKNN